VTVFLRVLKASVDDKQTELLRAVSDLREPSKRNEVLQHVAFEREPAAFTAVPKSPFAYWVSTDILGLFRAFPPFQDAGRIAASTNPLTEDSRYVRAWWEASADQLGATLRPWAKGGSFSPFYYDIPTVIAWDAERATYTGFLGGTSAWRRTRRHDEPGTIDTRPVEPPANYSHFLRPGLTWPRRTNGLSFRVLPRGAIFADKGPAIFSASDDASQLLALCAVINSRVFAYLMGVQLARTELAQSYEVGLVQQTPIPELDSANQGALARLARRAWSLKRSLDTTNETSHAFLLPPGPNEKVTRLERDAVERELAAIQRENDNRAFALYGIGPEDRAAIEVSSKGASAASSVDEQEEIDAADEDAAEDDAPVVAAADTLISWLVGVAFGRFDKRLATGERAIPAEPDPFDPLPSRSPGMWPEDEVRHVIPPVIMVDDPGHNEDIRAHVADVAAETGWPDPHNLRQWLAREFFPLHVKMYSKSRRKAPIYWQLTTPSASYSVWLYLHAFTKDTLYKVQNEYVAPKLAHEERKLESLRKELGESPRAAERKALGAQESFVEELRAFLDEVKRIAPLWNPDLDDGVIINFAPLWRLVPHHKPWQKELRATWDALCDGKYDWAHLAMHLWPERVVPKCAADRSLAIAHGLEDEFWLQDANGKWKARTTPFRPIDELVQERTSTAVKAALQSLLDAPAAQTRKASTRSKRAR
jgi:hypothetical protein